MPIKRYKPEQIVTMLRQIEVSIANGKTTPQACKEAEITIQTFYRWRKEYGGLKMDQAKRMKEPGERERQVETAGGGAGAGQTDPEGYCGGKLVSPERRRCAVEQAGEKYEVSERRACRVVRQWRGTQRYLPLRRTDEDQLTQAILALAVKYGGRYGYRRITALLRDAGWPVGQGSSAADLATRRAEGAAEAAATRAVVAGRWFVYSVAAGAERIMCGATIS